MNKSIFYILLLTALPLCFTGCRKEVRPTSMTIKDSVRHYYPIKQGQQLDIMFTITNTGEAPLIISEMQPSCGCIILDKSSHIIIPEDGIRQFKATYNSIKNVGEVVHRIRIFGNMLPNGKAELKFDVNVVPGTIPQRHRVRGPVRRLRPAVAYRQVPKAGGDRGI